MTKINKKIKVAVAMSGGVDSSVAASLLVEAGYDVVGVFMQFWFPKGQIYGENRCCSLKSFNEAKQVADILGINLYKLNFGTVFKKKVVDEFLLSYKKGQTPNPCVNCNKFIKFDLLYNKAKAIWNVDYLATGHYVRIKNDGDKICLCRGVDKQKDQSYFLYNLNQKILPHLIFPVGDYSKTKVRAMAKKYKLPVYDKSDSQEICFVGKSHYDFLQKFLKPKYGEIIDDFGNKLGRHKGLMLYTMGQRTGLGLSGGPWYVCGYDRKNNRLIVTKNQKNSNIYQSKLKAKDISWIGDKPKFPLKCRSQIRYRMKPVKCRVDKIRGGIEVVFDKKQRGIMPGQSVVFYDGDVVLGGGVIK